MENEGQHCLFLMIKLFIVFKSIEVNELKN